MRLTCEQWIDKNLDRLSELWVEYLCEMQDSSEHVSYMYSSDRCFQEFCEQQYAIAHAEDV